MRTAIRRALLAAAVLAAVACGGDGDDDGALPGDADVLTPTFEPLPSTTVADGGGGDGATTDGSAVGGEPGATSTTAPPSADPLGSTGGTGGGSDTTTAPPPSQSSFADAVGDVTPSPIDERPPWADLAGGHLSRYEADGYVLRIRLADDVPDATDDSHTMNIASFFDLDGDGEPDRHVWVNLSDTGWYPAYFGPDRAAYGEDAGVAVEVDGDELVLRFPLGHLDGADRFRWSLASEWGRYEAIGSMAAARDDAPDEDGAAAFPAS